MLKKLKSTFKKAWPYLLPLGCGGLIVSSFAPFNLAMMTFVGMTFFLYSIHDKSAKQAFRNGYLFGLGLFGLGASWIYVSIYAYGGESMIISGAITALFVLFLALFPAACVYTLNKVFPKPTILKHLFAFPALWVVFEMLRGWFLTGFPWLFIGYTQTDTQLIWLAPIGGVYLISWAVLFSCAVLFEIYQYVHLAKKNRKQLGLLLACGFSVWLAAFLLKGHPWTVSNGELSAALVQGNIEQSMRWDNEMIDSIANTYVQMSNDYLDADVMIWPESAIPLALPYSKPFFERMNALANQAETALIVGVPVVADDDSFYNGIVSIGQGQGVYYKRQLVPFGEYVPFESLLRGLIEFFDLPMSAFKKGPKQEPMFAKGYQVAPTVCYEIAYPFLVRRLAKDSQFIVTISNDAWFGRSIGPNQHLQIAQMRALESGQYVLRATNNGITAIILPNGDIKQAAPQFEQTVLFNRFEPMVGQTPWTKYGPWIITALLLLSFGIPFGQRFLSKK